MQKKPYTINFIVYGKKKCLRIGSRRQGILIHEVVSPKDNTVESLLGAASVVDVMKALENKPIITKEEVVKDIESL